MNLTTERRPDVDAIETSASPGPCIGREGVMESRKKAKSPDWAKRILAAGVAFLLGALAIVIPVKYPIPASWEDPLRRLGLALILSAVTYLVFQHTFEKGNRDFVIGAVDEGVDDIRLAVYKGVGRIDESLGDGIDRLSEMLKETYEIAKGLSGQSQILNGAIARNIEQIYAKRSDGLIDIIEDIVRSKNVKIVGVSLRDFYITAGKHFSGMDKALEAIVNSSDRCIKILLIDPNSQQAMIRAERESGSFDKENPYEACGLRVDVMQSIGYLYKKLANGKIEARVYSSAPFCFLVITDDYTYVEQYHYGIARAGLVGGNYPMLKFRNFGTTDSVKPAEATVSQHLEQHFDYIWDLQSSLPLDSLVAKHIIGTARGTVECQLVNLFPNRSAAQDRIKYLIDNTNGEIKLSGISLRDFLHHGKDFYDAIRTPPNADGSDSTVKCLMLDPASEQGILRSEREEPGVDPKLGNLYSEVATSIHSVERLMREGATIEAKLSSASPSCFMIMTDQSVLIEQYHFGAQESGATILGGKMPVMEFARNSPTYAELEGHFDYLWSDKVPSRTISDWNRDRVRDGAQP